MLLMSNHHTTHPYHNTTRRLTGAGAGNAKGVHSPHDAEDIMVEDGGHLDLAAVFILEDAVKVETLPARLEDLLVLLLETGNGVAGAGRGGCGRGFESEAVEGLRGLCVGHDGREMEEDALKLAEWVRSEHVHHEGENKSPTSWCERSLEKLIEAWR